MLLHKCTASNLINELRKLPADAPIYIQYCSLVDRFTNEIVIESSKNYTFIRGKFLEDEG